MQSQIPQTYSIKDYLEASLDKGIKYHVLYAERNDLGGVNVQLRPLIESNAQLKSAFPELVPDMAEQIERDAKEIIKHVKSMVDQPNPMIGESMGSLTAMLDV